MAIATPSGLTSPELEGLDSVELHALYEWMADKAGDDNGRRWWPYAVRSLPIEDRLALAVDPIADAHWEEMHRRAVGRDVKHLVMNFGHVQPEAGGAIPFLLWPEQEEVLDAFVHELRVIILKARQLGLTWLAVHYAVWLMAFNDQTPNAKILALSKHGQDATKLLGRARRICEMLPPFLRPAEDPETHRSLTRFKLLGTGELAGAGEMISLAGTPEAARMETATLALLDEFAHIKNRNAEPTWTAVQPTLGKRGKAIIIFTGNGPEEQPGNGQAAARLWSKAQAGQADETTGGRRLHPIFLPTSTDRSRTDEWHDEARRDFLSDEDFLAEYPETEEQALAGKSETKVYDLSGINAAARLGAHYDQLLQRGQVAVPGHVYPEGLDLLPPPADGGDGVEGLLLQGIDWGMGQSAILTGWPLENGGIYIPPLEVMESRGEPTDIMRAALDHALTEIQRRTPGQRAWPLIGQVRYDAAGAQSMASAIAWARANRLTQYRVDDRTRRHKAPTLGVSFGAPTTGRGARSYKELGVNYLRRLFKRTSEGHTTQVIAISPRNVTLLRQLRGLEFADDDQSKIRKRDDHGPDGLIAIIVPIALTYLDEE